MNSIVRGGVIINLKQIWSVEKKIDCGDYVIMFYNGNNNSRMVFDNKESRDKAWDDIVYEMDAEEI